MKKQYNNPQTEILMIHNIPVEMDANIESSSAAKLNQIPVSEENKFPMGAPKVI